MGVHVNYMNFSEQMASMATSRLISIIINTIFVFSFDVGSMKNFEKYLFSVVTMDYYG